MKSRILAALAGLAVVSAAASASPTFYSATAAGTSTVMHGNDRELTQLAFSGTPFMMTGPDFLRFQDGSLTNGHGTFGWVDPITRDIDGNNIFAGNPDRADGSTPFAYEGSSQGTLVETFSYFGGSYKNMSRLIDGEDTGSWTLDLFFSPGEYLDADGDASTVEIALLERGVNSDINVYGITTGNSLTGPIFVGRSNVGNAGWTLDTLEIEGAQTVGGVGISLDPSWTGLIGFRFEAMSDFNGPDLIAVGVTRTIPAPSSLALLGAFGVLARSRRR